MKHRILVVDDIILSHDVIKHYIKPYGIQVDSVMSGLEAVDAVRRESVIYSAVFVDQIMPVMDGFQTARSIREIGTKYAGTVPLIAITADSDIGDKSVFLRKGFQDFISKPVDALKLGAIVRRWINDNVSVLNESDEEPPKELRRSFVCNTPELVKKVKTAAESAKSIGDYAIYIHGIRGACRNIHADELSKKAGELEKAAKSGDYDFISANNPAFIEAVEKLLTSIKHTILKDTR